MRSLACVLIRTHLVLAHVESGAPSVRERKQRVVLKFIKNTFIVRSTITWHSHYMTDWMQVPLLSLQKTTLADKFQQPLTLMFPIGDHCFHL